MQQRHQENPRPDAGTIPDSSVVTDLAVTPDGAVLTDSAVSDGPVIKPDSTTTDSAPPADTLAADFTASTFKIVISEIMANPAKVIDSLGEWLELHNPTAAPIDIGGWRIADEGSDSHVISGSLVIPAGGYVVLALSTDTSKMAALQRATRSKTSCWQTPPMRSCSSTAAADSSIASPTPQAGRFPRAPRCS